MQIAGEAFDVKTKRMGLVDAGNCGSYSVPGCRHVECISRTSDHYHAPTRSLTEYDGQ